MERTLIREPGAEGPRQYTARVRRLAISFIILFIGSIYGIALLLWQGKQYVTLSQRSNVETLILAFFLLFFSYLALISYRGAWGATRLAWCLVSPPSKCQEHKVRMLVRGATPDPQGAAMNLLLEHDSKRDSTFEVHIEDKAGHVGRIVVDGARLTYHQDFGRAGSDVLAFFRATGHQDTEAPQNRSPSSDRSLGPHR